MSTFILCPKTQKNLPNYDMQDEIEQDKRQIHGLQVQIEEHKKEGEKAKRKQSTCEYD